MPVRKRDTETFRHFKQDRIFMMKSEQIEIIHDLRKQFKQFGTDKSKSAKSSGIEIWEGNTDDRLSINQKSTMTIFQAEATAISVYAQQMVRGSTPTKD